MQEVKLKSLGMEGTGQEPSTVEEFDAIAKKVGTCLTRAREYVRFHITLGDVRSIFLHGQEGKPEADGKPAVEEVIGVEDLTKIPRNTVPVLKEGKAVVKDGEPVVEYDESEKLYFNRVIATLVKDGKHADEDEARASFQELFDQAIKVVGFPAEASERKPTGPKRLPAKYKISAAITIALGNVEKVNTLMAPIKKTFTASGDDTKKFAGKATLPNGKEVNYDVSDKDAETLGWLLKEYQDYRTTQELASMGV